VCLTARTAKQEALRLLSRAGAAAAAVATLIAARQLGPRALAAAGGAVVFTATVAADAILDICDTMYSRARELLSPDGARRRRDRTAARRWDRRAAQARAAREAAAAQAAARARQAYNWAFDKAPVRARGG
jgi:hypothetical protein